MSGYMRSCEAWNFPHPQFATVALCDVLGRRPQSRSQHNADVGAPRFRQAREPECLLSSRLPVSLSLLVL